MWGVCEREVPPGRGPAPPPASPVGIATGERRARAQGGPAATSSPELKSRGAASHPTPVFRILSRIFFSLVKMPMQFEGVSGSIARVVCWTT